MANGAVETDAKQAFGLPKLNPKLNQSIVPLAVNPFAPSPGLAPAGGLQPLASAPDAAPAAAPAVVPAAAPAPAPAAAPAVGGLDASAAAPAAAPAAARTAAPAVGGLNDPATRMGLLTMGLNMMQAGGKWSKPEDEQSPLGIIGGAGLAGMGAYEAKKAVEATTAHTAAQEAHTRKMEELAQGKGRQAVKMGVDDKGNDIWGSYDPSKPTEAPVPMAVPEKIVIAEKKIEASKTAAEKKEEDKLAELTPLPGVSSLVSNKKGETFKKEIKDGKNVLILVGSAEIAKEKTLSSHFPPNTLAARMTGIYFNRQVGQYMEGGVPVSEKAKAAGMSELDYMLKNEAQTVLGRTLNAVGAVRMRQTINLAQKDFPSLRAYHAAALGMSDEDKKIVANIKDGKIPNEFKVLSQKEFTDMNNAEKGSDIQKWNAFKIWIGNQSSDPRFSKLKTQALVTAERLATVYQGGVGSTTDAKMKIALDLMDTSQGSEAFEGILSVHDAGMNEYRNEVSSTEAVVPLTGTSGAGGLPGAGGKADGKLGHKEGDTGTHNGKPVVYRSGEWVYK